MYYLLEIKYLDERCECGKYYELIHGSALKKTLVSELAKDGIKYHAKVNAYCESEKVGRECWYFLPMYVILNEKQFNEVKNDVANYFGK